MLTTLWQNQLRLWFSLSLLKQALSQWPLKLQKDVWLTRDLKETRNASGRGFMQGSRHCIWLCWTPVQCVCKTPYLWRNHCLMKKEKVYKFPEYNCHAAAKESTLSGRFISTSSLSKQVKQWLHTSSKYQDDNAQCLQAAGEREGWTVLTVDNLRSSS